MQLPIAVATPHGPYPNNCFGSPPTAKSKAAHAHAPVSRAAITSTAGATANKEASQNRALTASPSTTSPICTPDTHALHTSPIYIPYTHPLYTCNNTTHATMYTFYYVQINAKLYLHLYTCNTIPAPSYRSYIHDVPPDAHPTATFDSSANLVLSSPFLPHSSYALLPQHCFQQPSNALDSHAPANIIPPVQNPSGQNLPGVDNDQATKYAQMHCKQQPPQCAQKTQSDNTTTINQTLET